MDTEDYKEAARLLHEASTQEELDSKFHTSIQRKPHFFSKHLKKEYKTKKASFEITS